MPKLSRRNFLKLSAAFGAAAVAPWQRWETEEPPPLLEVAPPPAPIKSALPHTMLWIEKEPVYGITNWTLGASLPDTYDFDNPLPIVDEYNITLRFTVTHMGLARTDPSAFHYVVQRLKVHSPLRAALAYNPDRPTVYLMHFNRLLYVEHTGPDPLFMSDTYVLSGIGKARGVPLTTWLDQLEATV